MFWTAMQSCDTTKWSANLCEMVNGGEGEKTIALNRVSQLGLELFLS